MEKGTLESLSYNELMELYLAVREELRRRNRETPIHIEEGQYGTD